MECGGLSVMTPLDQLMLMWHVDNWALPQPRDMELWALWGKQKFMIVITTSVLIDFHCRLNWHAQWLAWILARV